MAERVEIPFVGPHAPNRERPLSSQISRNMWAEINPEARNEVAMHNMAGTRVFATLEGIDRGMHDFNNLMYAVNGGSLYSIDAEGAEQNLGSIGGTGRCVMANDQSQLIITTGDTPYRYTVAGGVEAITDPDLVKPTCVAYLNSQFLFDQNDGVWGEFVTSSIEPGLAIDALDFANAESHPDDIVRIIAFRQFAWMFGSQSVEPWQNTGSGNPPWARVNSGVQPYGLIGLHAVTTTTENIYFLDHKRIPRRSNGLNFVNIGNPAIGVEFAKYSKLDDCICYEFTQDNQQFVVFTFPSANRTWCFHEQSGSWSQMSHGVDDDRHRASSMLNVYGLNYCADHTNGLIYEYSLDIYSDNGDPIIKERSTATIHGGLYGAPGKRLWFDEVEFIIVGGQTEVEGTGLGAQPGTPIPTPEDPTTLTQARCLAWWEFEEVSGGTGTLLYEEVGDTTLRSSNTYTSVTGVRAQGARLQVSGNENIDSQNTPVGSTIDLTLRDQVWSCAFWWKTPSTLVGVAGDYLVCQWVHSLAVEGDRRWRVIYNATEDGFDYSIGNNVNPAVFVTLSTGDIGLTADTWYHIVVTHDPNEDEMSITASERGGTVGTRFTEAVSGGAHFPGPPDPIIDFTISVGRDFSGVVKTDGTCDMLSFWGETAILSEADVLNLFENELTYAELPIVGVTEIVAPFWENTGTWINLSLLTQTTYETMFGYAVENDDFNAVYAVDKAALVNTADAGNRLQIQDSVDCTNAALYITDSGGNVVDSMIYANVPNGDSVLIPADSADYYVVITSDTGNAKIKKWDSSEVSTVGSVSWESFFGRPFELGEFYNELNTIPADGAAIRFTIPETATAYHCDFTLLEVPSNPGQRQGSVNQTVGDYTSAPTYTWGLGGGIDCGINQSGTDKDLIPGQTYFFNIRHLNPYATTYVQIQVSTLAF